MVPAVMPDRPLLVEQHVERGAAVHRGRRGGAEVGGHAQAISTRFAVGDTAAVLPARPADAPGTARVVVGEELMQPPANEPAGRSGCR